MLLKEDVRMGHQLLSTEVNDCWQVCGVIKFSPFVIMELLLFSVIAVAKISTTIRTTFTDI
jgi:hypothetical protein